MLKLTEATVVNGVIATSALLQTDNYSVYKKEYGITKKTSAGRLDTMWRRMCYLCTRENNDGRCADG